MTTNDDLDEAERDAFDDIADAPEEGARLEGKRDRLARLLSVLRVLQAHGDAGISPAEIARRTGMSKRSIYRDLKALETEMQVPLWSDKGKWGVQPGAFLPPLRLSLQEAMAVFLSARLVTRYADKYEPNLASAFEKLGEALPDALRQHVEGTLDDLSQRRVDPDFNRHVADLTKAWAERRVVRFRYQPARYDGTDREPRTAEVRAVPPRAVARDPRAVPHRPRPDARRDPHVQGGADRGPRRSPRRPSRRPIRPTSRRRCGGRGTSSPTSRRPRSCCASIRRSRPGSARRRGTRARRSRRVADGSLEWRARVAGTIEIRLWILSWGDEVEVLAPPELRADVAATHARAASRYGEG